jgi:HAD superfamily hydrolase (TIGR01509 family)
MDAGIHGLFDAIITCEDVTRPKPAPDIYLLAAERIKCDPAKCRGFEDGDVGMDSLIAAGMQAVDVRYMAAYPRDINGMRTRGHQDDKIV